MSGQPVNLVGVTGSALLVWGWFAGYFVVAVPVALAIELTPRLRWRIQLGDRELNRLVDLTSLVVMGLSLYLISVTGPRSIFQILIWLPLTFFPLMLAQRYSTVGRLKGSHLFWSLRRPGARNLALTNMPIDFLPIYIAITLIAATATSPGGIGLPLTILLLVGWLLFLYRSKRMALYSWGFSLLLVLGLAFFVQAGLKVLHGEITVAVVDWMAGKQWTRKNLSASHTAIGRLGELKLSDKLLFRVKSRFRPPLLRQASFQDYHDGNWLALNLAKSNLKPGQTENVWQIPDRQVGAVGPENLRQLIFTGSIEAGTAVLPLPGTTTQLANLAAEKVTLNSLGALQIEGAPGFLDISVSYRESANGRDQLPDKFDLLVPEDIKRLLAEIIDRRGIRGKPAVEVVNSIQAFFQGDFRYSLVQKSDAAWFGKSPIDHFLTESQQGHCEFYATATVLLLREAGVAARYATGFAAVEAAATGNWPVRLRHAHAWALVWLNGRWTDIDTTPAIWAEREAENASALQPLKDLFYTLYDYANAVRWQISAERQITIFWLIPLAVILLLYSLWRFRGKLKKRQIKNVSKVKPLAVHVQPTAFNSVIERLEAKYAKRQTGETLVAWIQRVCPQQLDRLQPLITTHYQLRFSAQVPDKAVQEGFQQEVDQFLQQLAL